MIKSKAIGEWISRTTTKLRKAWKAGSARSWTLRAQLLVGVLQVVQTLVELKDAIGR